MESKEHQPLATKLRPVRWEDFVLPSGLLPSLLDRYKRKSLSYPSLILWGPPGVGKTSFAKLIGINTSLVFMELSGVYATVKDIRQIADNARSESTPILLFVDEIHRFNKAQQDAFLPYVEDGLLVLIGATTENPSFALTSALCSRMEIIRLSALTMEALGVILKRACTELGVALDARASAMLCDYALGDARRLLSTLSQVITVGESAAPHETIGVEQVNLVLGGNRTVRYDRDGELHYDLISAFVKSLRGSDPDAALYWAFRILEGGEDPRFIFRRLIIFASEDIGNADPRALLVAVAAAEAFERVGLPEGRIPLAHAITYLGVAPKSNRAYKAMHEAVAAVQRFPHAEVPLHLRNAPTALMQSEGFSKGYEYPHDFPEGYVPNARYLPKEVEGAIRYQPGNQGLEAQIAQKLTRPAREKK